MYYDIDYIPSLYSLAGLQRLIGTDCIVLLLVLVLY